MPSRRAHEHIMIMIPWQLYQKHTRKHLFKSHREPILTFIFSQVCWEGPWEVSPVLALWHGAGLLRRHPGHHHERVTLPRLEHQRVPGDARRHGEEYWDHHCHHHHIYYQVRTIRHFHFTTWPDFGVPEPPQILVRWATFYNLVINGKGIKLIN